MDENKENLYRFEKFIVFYNPASTNAKKSRKRINDLKQLFPGRDIEVVETSPDGYDANRKIIVSLTKRFDDKTILCIASGDGTVSIVLDSLLFDKGISDSARKVTILPLWGGNANDLAVMANGHSRTIRTRRIFDKGVIKSIYPINFSITKGSKKYVKNAACYASFGASAFATKNLETPKRRTRRIYKIPGSRLLAEMSVVTYSFLKAPTFKASIDGKVKNIYEYIFINGSRLAKVEGVPIKLGSKEFYEALFFNKHPIILLNILKALRNRSYGRSTKGPIEFEVKSDVDAQFDGELEKITANTKIKVSSSDKPFYVLATKL